MNRIGFMRSAGRLCAAALLAVSVAAAAFAGSNPDAEFGAVSAPGYLKYYDTDYSDRVATNPYMQVGTPETPLFVDEGTEYIWIIDKDGRFVLGEEAKSPWGRTYRYGFVRPEDGSVKGDGYSEKYGHAALVGGKPARIAGELFYEKGAWVMNNKSSRFTKGRADRTEAQLKNAAALFVSLAPAVSEVKVKYLTEYGARRQFATKADMTDIEYHYQLDPAGALVPGTGKLSRAFMEKTPFIKWKNKPAYKEGFYIDTYDRYLKKRNQVLRVRFDLKKPEKSKVTLKSRSADVSKVTFFGHEPGGEIDAFFGEEAYSYSVDTPVRRDDLDLTTATPAQVFELLKRRDPAFYALTRGLRAQGLAKIGASPVMSMGKFKGKIAQGGFAGREVELQVWTVKGDAVPVLAEVGFSGDITDKAKLDARDRWLSAILKRNGLLAADPGGSKTEISFGLAGRFHASDDFLKALEGPQCRNADGTVNILLAEADGAAAKVAATYGERAAAGTVRQTLVPESGKALPVVVLDGPGSGSCTAVIAGMKDGVLVAVAGADRAGLRKIVDSLGNRGAAINAVGDANVAFLKANVKRGRTAVLMR